MSLHSQALQVLPSPLAVLVNPAGKRNITRVHQFRSKEQPFFYSSYIVSLDSHYVLLVPEDQPLLGRLSNPATKTKVRSVFDWSGGVGHRVKLVLPQVRAPRFSPQDPGKQSVTFQDRAPEHRGRTVLILVWFLPLVPLSLPREPLCLLGGPELLTGPERGDRQLLLLFYLCATKTAHST